MPPSWEDKFDERFYETLEGSVGVYYNEQKWMDCEATVDEVKAFIQPIVDRLKAAELAIDLKTTRQQYRDVYPDKFE